MPEPLAMNIDIADVAQPVRLARASDRSLARALRRFAPTHRDRVAATAERHPWVADLATSFPALLFALAVTQLRYRSRSWAGSELNPGCWRAVGGPIGSPSAAYPTGCRYRHRAPRCRRSAGICPHRRRNSGRGGDHSLWRIGVATVLTVATRRIARLRARQPAAAVPPCLCQPSADRSTLIEMVCYGLRAPSERDASCTVVGA